MLLDELPKPLIQLAWVNVSSTTNISRFANILIEPSRRKGMVWAYRNGTFEIDCHPDHWTDLTVIDCMAVLFHLGVLHE